MKNTLIAIIVIIVLGLGVGVWFYSSPKDSAIPDGDETADIFNEGNSGEAVATVNGEEISSSEFESLKSQVIQEQELDAENLDEQTEEQIETQVIDSLVSQVLLQQIIDQSDISVEDSEVDTQIQTIVSSQFGGDQEAFQTALTETGMNEADLQSQIKQELKRQAYFEQELDFSSISATQEEIQATYDQVSANQDVPSLEEVSDQVENMVLQQKQQQLIEAHVEELRAEAEVEILI